jgi:hypothetical protein
MTPQQQLVLDALYRLEEGRLSQNQFDFWITPQDIRSAIVGNESLSDAQVRQALRDLWVQRRVMQICWDDSPVESFADVMLDGTDRHGTEATLAIEQDDVRGAPGVPHLQVAIYPLRSDVRYRSRIAEIGRMLSYNYQRFNMAPATGLLRYERRPQRRPLYTAAIPDLIDQWTHAVGEGWLPMSDDSGAVQQVALDSQIDRARLCNAITGVLEALAEQFHARHRPPNLAPFQVQSITATLAGLYSHQYRTLYDAHVVTAGVGSGKSFAFQVGALIHVAYKALLGERRLQVLLLYPRVVLAANQFQDLQDLVTGASNRLGTNIQMPLLDAGGQLRAQLGIPEGRGATLQAITTAYQTDFQILISNLDTLANRLVHPEAAEGLGAYLDLVVFDEVHLLSGIYGGHARMLLRRVEAVRTMRRLRSINPEARFEQLLQQRSSVRPPYFVAASATISEPRQHTARLLSRPASRVRHIGPGITDETGWVHHFFLRQRPEVSSQTAAINATSCLIHNRRNGTFREYFQRQDGAPISLEHLSNPVEPSQGIELRQAEDIHKTLGFCDSLDAVGSWADLVGDNEQTKFASMPDRPSPSAGSDLPYFVRFQEPLWRAVHYSSFPQLPNPWKEVVRQHYGRHCRKCKQGVRCRTPRIPPGVTARQAQNIQNLWNGPAADPDTYISRLNIDPELYGAAWFDPLRQAATAPDLGTLDQCPFFQTGLCWWWSLDDLGSNRPTPASHQVPLHGFKRPLASQAGKYHAVNAIRLRTFTSNDKDFDVTGLNSVNDIFRVPGSRMFRNRQFGPTPVNSLFVIGSPRIEVGIDMSRVMDGITFRSMRDPASFQQKVGRIGREPLADSLAVHLVTGNLREQYYFRNPRIALDPDYLQAIPLHERNALVARNHYFMAIFDFLCMQGSGPIADRIQAHGDRINLVNDQAHGGFNGWAAKVKAAHAFLCGGHPRSQQNRANLGAYLSALGATPEEVEHPSHDVSQTGPAQPVAVDSAGALDVFRHDFGVGLLQTPIQIQGRSVTLAEVCQYPDSATAVTLPGLPRHEQFCRDYYAGDNRVMTRSYLWQVLTLPVFRRGVPVHSLRGNQPWLWVPTLFEAVGNESVQVFQETQSGRRDKGVETVSLAIALLCPGTFTYRYYNDTGPSKAPVSSGGGLGVTPLTPGVEAVHLNVHSSEYYENAGCPPVAPADLPEDFQVSVGPVPVYRPRQITLISAGSNPRPVARGLIADSDEAPFPQPPERIYNALPKPPQCHALRWYRIEAQHGTPVPCRFQDRFKASPGSPPLPRLDWPVVMRLFDSVRFDEALAVTDFVWGLDRTFTTRDPEPARLVYRNPDDPVSQAAAIGQYYMAPGFEFRVSFAPGTPVALGLSAIMSQPDGAAYQSLLWQVLHRFLSEHATNAPPPNAAPWIAGGRPSSFAVQNMVKAVAFHLIHRWCPSLNAPPQDPFRPGLADIRGCFDGAHPNYLSQQRFTQICEFLAQQQNPVDVAARGARLAELWTNLQRAAGHSQGLDDDYFLGTTRRIYLNSVGLSLQAAGLRLSGAEDGDIAYFYKELNPTTAVVYLFDTDQYGNGTAQLIRNHFYISPVERTLNERLAALGHAPDPLPTLDFVSTFEDSLQECRSSQAAHLAFHNLPTSAQPFADLHGAAAGERRTAGAAFDFVRLVLQQSSYDDLLPFQVCPEFLAYLASPVTGFAGTPLVGSPQYPTFQSLESALGMCVSGCVECLVAPEQNIRGPLAATTTVNKLLLDAIYTTAVCASPQPVTSVTYPAQGTGRTCTWDELPIVVAVANATPAPGTAAMQVRLLQPSNGQPAVDLSVVPAATPGPWGLVLRTDLGVAPVPQGRIRPRMTL